MPADASGQRPSLPTPSKALTKARALAGEIVAQSPGLSNAPPSALAIPLGVADRDPGSPSPVETAGTDPVAERIGSVFDSARATLAEVTARADADPPVGAGAHEEEDRVMATARAVVRELERSETHARAISVIDEINTRGREANPALAKVADALNRDAPYEGLERAEMAETAAESDQWAVARLWRGIAALACGHPAGMAIIDGAQGAIVGRMERGEIVFGDELYAVMNSCVAIARYLSSQNSYEMAALNQATAAQIAYKVDSDSQTWINLELFQLLRATGRQAEAMALGRRLLETSTDDPALNDENRGLVRLALLEGASTRVGVRITTADRKIAITTDDSLVTDAQRLAAFRWIDESGLHVEVVTSAVLPQTFIVGNPVLDALARRLVTDDLDDDERLHLLQNALQVYMLGRALGIVTLELMFEILARAVARVADEACSEQALGNAAIALAVVCTAAVETARVVDDADDPDLDDGARQNLNELSKSCWGLAISSGMIAERLLHWAQPAGRAQKGLHDMGVSRRSLLDNLPLALEVAPQT